MQQLLFSLTLNAPTPPVIFLSALCTRWTELKLWQRRLYSLIFLSALFGIPLTVLVLRGRMGLLILAQVLLLTILICLMPTISQWFTIHKRRFIRLILETILYTVLLVFFSIWIFGISSIRTWSVQLITLILILEMGGYIIELNKEDYINRIAQNLALKDILIQAQDFENLSLNELSLYFSVPIGLLLGTLSGLFNGLNLQQIIPFFCLPIILLLSSLILIYFLIISFTRMSDSLFREVNIQMPTIRQENHDGITNRIRSVFRLIVPVQTPQSKDQKKNELDLAIEISNFRKLYLYDSIHNAVLLISFLIFNLKLWSINFEIKYVIFTFLVSLFLFCQLPYVIGQSRLHKKLSGRYSGREYSEVVEQLEKLAPIFPKFIFLGSLFATGTTGGMIYYLIDQFLKNAFK